MFVTILFFVTYSLVLLYIYSSKKRSKRLESYKNIPFQDGDDDVTPQRKENEHE
ncbi:MAG: cbb3-type cytochrome c oxidase subunit 3 [Gammaproteobacteria bacterium]|nr:cbb3-type cytochrome c oxidase subunit 3 [Gammaproteobacteria bacterium]